MADEAHYNSAVDASAGKRKYDDSQQQLPSPPRRRTTGFSAPISSDSAPPPASGSLPPPPASYSSVPPPVDEIQLAKQRAQEIAARLFNAASAGTGDAKRTRVDNGSGSESSYGSAGPTDYGQKAYGFGAPPPPSAPASYGGYNSGPNKKIEIPNGRVGVIIGKGGETIKYLQLQSGAKIQVQRDAEADMRSNTRLVELTGTADQVEKAEQLIHDVLKEAEIGGSGTVNRRFNGEPGGEQFAMQIPNNKVGLVIGKGGETIKSMQAQTGARIQIIPLHLPPGDPATERRLQIDGTNEQIEQAKQLVFEVISENRSRNTSMGGGYSQGYQGRTQSNWGHQGGTPLQPTYGEYGQPGAYPTPPAQYSTQASYGGYPQQPTTGGYAPSWDPSNQGQQAAQGGGYDYYTQQNQLQSQAPQAQGDNTGYNYNQQPPSGYGQQAQGYGQDAYNGGYAYGQQQTGYEQQHSYNSASYGGPAANTTQDGAQADGTQAPPPGQQGYGTNQQPNSGNSTSQTAVADPTYGVPPNPGYGSQPGSQSSYGPSYGTPQGQKPTSTPPAYGQSQHQSPNTQGGYAQAGYTLPPPPPPAGYSQADSGSQKAAPPAYYAQGAQPTYAALPAYGSAPGTQPGYTQQPSYAGGYGSAYSQPPAYGSTESNGSGNATAPQAGSAAASTKSGGDASPQA